MLYDNIWNFYLQRIEEQVKKDFKSYIKCLENKHMVTYMKECCRLGWKMAMQRPQMTFRQPQRGHKLDPKEQELSWGSDPDGKNACIKYSIYPVLMHGDKLMVKGRVFVK